MKLASSSVACLADVLERVDAVMIDLREMTVTSQLTSRHRLLPCAAVVLTLWAAGCSALPDRASDRPAGVSTGAIPRDELRMASDEAAVLQGARALMEADRVVALVTVDGSGQPRVRSVRALLEPAGPSEPKRNFTVWVMTRLATRKVAQIRAHPQVTLYFNNDETDSYASIMGTAVVHTDPTHPAAQRRFEGEDVKSYWPDFPRDFVMLEIQPQWLEFIGPAIANDERTWRPQAVVFD